MYSMIYTVTIIFSVCHCILSSIDAFIIIEMRVAAMDYYNGILTKWIIAKALLGYLHE